MVWLVFFSPSLISTQFLGEKHKRKAVLSWTKLHSETALSFQFSVGMVPYNLKAGFPISAKLCYCSHTKKKKKKNRSDAQLILLTLWSISCPGLFAYQARVHVPIRQDGHVASTLMLITVLSVSVQSQSMQQTDFWMLWLYPLMKSETVWACPKQPLNSLPCEPKCPEILMLYHYQRVSMHASCTCVQHNHLCSYVCSGYFQASWWRHICDQRLTISVLCPKDGENCPSWIWVEAVAGLSVGSVLAACWRFEGVVLNLQWMKCFSQGYTAVPLCYVGKLDVSHCARFYWAENTHELNGEPKIEKLSACGCVLIVNPAEMQFVR